MRISPTVYRLETPKESNVYVVQQGRDYILIDTGEQGISDEIILELRQLDIHPKSIKHILLTHHDVDHIGNAKDLQYMTGATLWASKEDIPYIMKEKRRPNLNIVQHMMLKTEVPYSISAVSPGQKFGEIEAIATPGRTPGHMVYLFQIYMFTGDLIQSSHGHRAYPKQKDNWSYEELKKSVIKVDQVHFSLILPGHGEPIDKNIIDPYSLEGE